MTFDFLGLGRSDKPSGGAYSFAQQRGDLTAVADTLGLETGVPVVHDSASMLGINFAIDQPGRTDSLVILNCAFSDALPVHRPELIEVLANARSEVLAAPCRRRTPVQRPLQACPDRLRDASSRRTSASGELPRLRTVHP